MLQNLPLEIIRRIFDSLFFSNLIQCQLVSQKWSQPAQAQIYKTIMIYNEEQLRLLLRTLVSSSSINSLVRKLQISSNASLSFEECKQLVLHTPNLRFFCHYKLGDVHYEMILWLINQGYWKNLEVLRYPDPIDRMCRYSRTAINCDTYYYYAACSALKDRLKEIDFNHVAFSQLYEEMHFFRFPNFVTRQTRFPKVETVFYGPNTLTNFRSLEDTLQLFPTMNKLTMDLISLEILTSDLETIEPNTNVTRLEIGVKRTNNNVLRYIFKKFPSVKHLKLKLRYYVSDLVTLVRNLPLELINQLATYAAQADTLEIEVNDIHNIMDLFDAFKIPPFKKGDMTISLLCSDFGRSSAMSGLKIEFQKKDYSYLCLFLEKGQYLTGFGKRNSAFLSVLDELRYVGCNAPSDRTMELCKEILKYCKKMRSFTLEECDFDELVLETPNRSCTEIQICNSNYTKNTLKTLSKSFPRLSDLVISGSVMELGEGTYDIVMPDAKLDLLDYTLMCDDADVFLHLRRGSCNNTYFHMMNAQLQKITQEEFERQTLDPETVKLYVACQSLANLMMLLGDGFCEYKFS
ncbi:hypothetical protein EDC96DRAFT_504043 [Choanephora cucurbitarum]|nr:hypothetical protein EDC96DRAFT_504043 [Choanephora cucurbitarum]